MLNKNEKFLVVTEIFITIIILLEKNKKQKKNIYFIRTGYTTQLYSTFTERSSGTQRYTILIVSHNLFLKQLNKKKKKEEKEEEFISKIQTQKITLIR